MEFATITHHLIWKGFPVHFVIFCHRFLHPLRKELGLLYAAYLGYCSWLHLRNSVISVNQLCYCYMYGHKVPVTSSVNFYLYRLI